MTLRNENPPHFNNLGALPEERLLARTRLPDSEPIYHEIEEERQHSLSLRQQRSKRQNLVGEKMSPALQRVVSIDTTAIVPGRVIKPLRPLPELQVPPNALHERNIFERAPCSDVKDSWVMYGDAFESESVLTGLSRQELIRRRPFELNKDARRKKDKKYGKKKNKSIILSLPLGFPRRSDVGPKYCRGADELSSKASAGEFLAKSQVVLADQWARKRSRRFISASIRRSLPNNLQHDTIRNNIPSRSPENLNSSSPRLQALNNATSVKDHVGFSQNGDHLVQDSHASSSFEQQISMHCDEASFPFLSATEPHPNSSPSRPLPSHYDSSVTHSSAAASDQAVTDSVATLDGQRMEPPEPKLQLDHFFAMPSAGDTGYEKGEDCSTLATEATIGNVSPTSIVDINPGRRPPVLHHGLRTLLQERGGHNRSAPKSILRRKNSRGFFPDCPSDEGRIDENKDGIFFQKHKTVRLIFEASEDQVSKSPPREGSFKDKDGLELSPILSVKPESLIPPSFPETKLSLKEDHVSPEKIQLFHPVLFNEAWSEGHQPADDGWRQSNLTKPDSTQVREINDFSEVESDGHSCGFIEEVAAVVIQTAARQFLAKHTVCDMLEKLMLNVRESDFNDMTIRMFNLAAVKIQSAFRGWWLRDSLSVDHYCATLIQRIFRGFLNRTNYHFDLYRVIVVQSIWRRNIVREAAVEHLARVIAIQAVYRGFAVRKSIDDAWGLARKEVWAATKIQARWRGYDAQMNYLHTLADILVVQSMARVWITQQLILPYLQSQPYKSLTKPPNDSDPELVYRRLGKKLNC